MGARSNDEEEAAPAAAATGIQINTRSASPSSNGNAILEPLLEAETPSKEIELFGYPISVIRTFAYMALNVASSIGIVMTNKWVFEVYNFRFGTFLTIIHFVITFLGLEGCARNGVFEKKKIPLSAMAKVLTTPCIVVIQTFYYNMTFSTPVKLALTVTCIGVIISSATDVQLNVTGTFFALTGVLVTSLYQIWVGTKQKDLGVNSMQLLYYQAPLSAILLVPVVPILDDVGALFAYEWSVGAIVSIMISAIFAFFVNISIFLVIGKTSAVTYNVLGHFKLCLILLLGFIIFSYPVNLMNLLGIVVTLAGVFWYSDIQLRAKR
ncbi:hypothetical protein SmJEL517_g04179 [Synchytrium microbalum]|uniref:Sugar phosphate transporter domain-containing protein n=1 Tax=Synchytrium microbalum TaxID=1806994 RepID=A0A507C3U3_9FUNG|nr:uncharacterized protein SmJEL517_g04179 [Synchytrium microbalum]TPX32784.1 hypothetical protein SmJEL517_g04179 [Synchytrium microbalum]